MRLLISVTLLICCLFFTAACCAQVCTGSLGAPVINQTFGKGTTFTPGPELPSGLTNLRYFNDNCGGPNDGGEGVYTLQTSMGTSCKGGTWQSISHDHTGEQNGYMMIINAGSQPDVFFTQRVAGNTLCPNSVYFFGAWIMNILRDLPQTQGFSQPNITFSIETTDGRQLGTPYNTGVIQPEKGEGKWVQYGMLFTTPADGSDFVVKMTNNAPGGNGNDFAMDDITFSPCGQFIPTGFTTIGNVAPQSSCRGDNLLYTLVADPQGYTNPSLQWQQNLNDGNGWKDLPGQTTASASISINNAAPGKYQYRIGALGAAQAGAEACRIYSDPLTVNVYPQPNIVLSNKTSACIGSKLQLSSTGGDQYEWTGPNNFTSAESSPVVSYASKPTDNGTYSVKVTSNGCPSFATTVVTVYEQATVQPMQPLTICKGDAATLSPQTANATYYKWTPATGLDHDDIINPVANPTVTTTYSVEVNNDGGCPSTASVVVNVLEPPAANAGKSIRLIEGETAKLTGEAQGDNLSRVYWSPTDFLDNATSLTPQTSAINDITYTLHVESVQCGESTSSVFVRVLKKLTIPNTFSPNNDGFNDLWNINNLVTYSKAVLTIFTRAGVPVFRSTGYVKAWDGNLNGKALPADTYYYVIDLKDDGLPPLSGWVLLVR